MLIDYGLRGVQLELIHCPGGLFPQDLKTLSESKYIYCRLSALI
jgi:hypothetical protein